MANDKLENLVRIRQLKAELAAADEISGLLRSEIRYLVFQCTQHTIGLAS